MTRITVSAKVTSELIDRIAKTGHRTSDVVQAGLENFLNMPIDQQRAILRDHLIMKKRVKAMNIYANR